MAVPEDLLHRVEGMALVAHIKALLQLATTFAKKAPRAVIIGHVRSALWLFALLEL